MASIKNIEQVLVFCLSVGLNYGQKVSAFASDKLNQELKNKLPEIIKISPEIAFLIANESRKLESQLQKSDKETGFTRKLLMLHGNIAYGTLFPNPHAAVAIGRGVGNLVKSMREDDKRRDKIFNDSNKIVSRVLGAYQLQGSVEDGYQLRCGQYAAAVTHVGYRGEMTWEAVIGNLGINKELDFEALEQTVKEKHGKSRGGPC
jgi:hypothetical protein